jgi:acid phosphatase (class A)
VSRATVYSQSRVVCGLHFPGDVEAGHALGAAIMGRLMEQPAFINDLRCARREYNAVIAGARSEDLPLCQ